MRSSFACENSALPTDLKTSLDRRTPVCLLLGFLLSLPGLVIAVALNQSMLSLV